MLTFREDKPTLPYLTLRQLKTGTLFTVSSSCGADRTVYMAIPPVTSERDHRCTAVEALGGHLMTFGDSQLVLPVVVLRMEGSELIWREATPSEWGQFVKDVAGV